MPKQNFGLGRGLGSLIPNKDRITDKNTQPSGAGLGADKVKESGESPKIVELPVDMIVSNRHQPRKYFDQESLNELTESIKAHGIIQPLVVVPDENGNYELIAGERRLRSSKAAGLKKVPVILREADELERLELALIENIQRCDLNPIEEAEAYQKLNDEFGLTHEQIGKRVGKTRPLISNAIRLLGLPQEIQKAIAHREITPAHGRLILEIHDEKKQMDMFRKIISEKLNISDTTREVKNVEVNRHTRRVTKDPNIEEYERRLQALLGTKVVIGRRGKNVGLITIEFYGDDELKDIISKLLSGG